MHPHECSKQRNVIRAVNGHLLAVDIVFRLTILYRNRSSTIAGDPKHEGSHLHVTRSILLNWNLPAHDLHIETEGYVRSEYRRLSAVGILLTQASGHLIILYD